MYAFGGTLGELYPLQGSSVGAEGRARATDWLPDVFPARLAQVHEPTGPVSLPGPSLLATILSRTARAAVPLTEGNGRLLGRSRRPRSLGQSLQLLGGGGEEVGWGAGDGFLELFLQTGDVGVRVWGCFQTVLGEWSVVEARANPTPSPAT